MYWSKAHGGDRVSVGFDLNYQMDKPEGLQCFLKILGRLGRNLAADTGDFVQFDSAGRLFACGSHFFSQIGKAFGKSEDCFVGDDN